MGKKHFKAKFREMIINFWFDSEKFGQGSIAIEWTKKIYLLKVRTWWKSLVWPLPWTRKEILAWTPLSQISKPGVSKVGPRPQCLTPTSAESPSRIFQTLQPTLIHQQKILFRPMGLFPETSAKNFSGTVMFLIPPAVRRQIFSAKLTPKGKSSV